MNAVIYASKGGNTKKLAESIARGAGVSAHSVSEVVNLEDNIDLLFVGGSIYAGKIDGLLRKFLQGLSADKVKKVAVFGSAAGSKSALPEVREILSGTGITVLDEVFQCNGSFLLANRGRPNADDLKHAEDFAKKLCGDI